MRIEIQVALLLADPVLIARIERSILVLIEWLLSKLSTILRCNVLEALPEDSIVIALGEVGNLDEMIRLV